MLATTLVNYEEVKSLADQISPEIAMDDELFDEVSRLNQLLREIPMDVFEKNSPEDKWRNIFKDNNTLPRLYKLVSKVLSVPVSNAVIERVFSLINAQWTKERNSLIVDTIKAIAQVKVNFEEKCSEMYGKILKSRKLLKKIASCEKYGV